MKNLIILSILPDLFSKNFWLTICFLVFVFLVISKIIEQIKNHKTFKKSQLNSFNFEKSEVGLVFEIIDTKNNLIFFKKHKLNQFDKLVYMEDVYIDKKFCLSQYVEEESILPGKFFMLFITSIQSNLFILKPGAYEHNRFVTNQSFAQYQNRA